MNISLTVSVRMKSKSDSSIGPQIMKLKKRKHSTSILTANFIQHSFRLNTSKKEAATQIVITTSLILTQSLGDRLSPLLNFLV